MSADPVPLRGLAGVPDVAGDHLNAQRFLATYGADVRRSPELGRWYLWNGSWSVEDRLERVLDMAADCIDQLREWVTEANGPDELGSRSAHYSASAKAGRRDALLSIVGTDPDVVVAVRGSGRPSDAAGLWDRRASTFGLVNYQGPVSQEVLLTRGVSRRLHHRHRSW